MPDSPFLPGSQVVAYVRASPGNEQDLSVLRQESIIRAWCSENNLVLTTVYSDDARSGGSVAGRV